MIIRCPFCGYHTTSLEELEEHLLNSHPREEGVVKVECELYITPKKKR